MRRNAAAVCSASHGTASDGEPAAVETRAEPILTRIEVHFQESYRRKAADLCWRTRHVSVFFALELRGNPDHLSRVSLVQRWIIGKIAHARDVIRIASSRPLDQARGKTPVHSPSRP